ncbi:ATP-grasp domain-containing protein [Mariniflexile soesokkakense]|uniref:ATP-grasp domain-containing protein n=1 Tax=Mariniflexile soesokkakense TaxID=1343160 RepID=A0ABV0AD77_9FLAO
MKKNKKQFSILIPEVDSNLLLFVINCLSQIKEFKLFVIVNKPFEEIKYSRNISHYTYYPKFSDETKWLSSIEKEVNEHNIDIVMPINEYGIQTLIKHKNNISYASKLVLLPSIESFIISNNKGLLWKHMITYKIPCPDTFLYNKNEFHSENLLEYPLLIKPLEGFGGGEGIHIFKNKEELNNYYSSNKNKYPYLIQNYIDGYDIDCSVLCENGEVISYTIQKGILFGEHAFAPKAGLEFLYEPDLLEVVKDLMKTLNWSGVAHIDLRFDNKDKKFKVIEINPRFWRSVEASEIAGVNFPYLYILKSLNEEFEIPKYKEIKYLDLLGLKKMIKKNIFFLFNTRFILNNTPIKYYLKDPIPFAYMFYYKLKNMFSFRF